MSLLNKASLIQIPSGYKDGTLYSAKPTNGDGDFTFSRGSNLAATRVNSEGLIEKGRENVILYSQEIDNPYWNKFAMSVTANQTVAPDGTTTADLIDDGTSTGVHGIEEKGNMGGGVATASIHAKYLDTQYLCLSLYDTSHKVVVFDIQNGTIGNKSLSSLIPTIEDLGDGWYRCAVTYPSNTRVDPFVTFGLRDDNVASFYTGAGDNRQAYVWGVQLEQSLVATDYIETTTTTAQAGILEDMPRLDYSGGSCPSLLLEPQRSNELPHSEYFDDFTDTGVTLNVNDATSPEGVINAYKLTEDSANSQHKIRKDFSVSAGTYTISVFVKGTSRYVSIYPQFATVAYAVYDLSNQTVTYTGGANYVSSDIIDYGNDWYRLILTCNTSANTMKLNFYLSNSATSEAPTYTGDGSSYLHFYGAMVEAGSYPTSYIPTYGSSVTRSAENTCSTSASALQGNGIGTFFYNFERNGIDTSNTGPGLQLYSSSGEQIRLHFDAPSAQIRWRDALNSYATIGPVITANVGQNIKTALVSNGTTIKVFVNGSQLGSAYTIVSTHDFDQLRLLQRGGLESKQALVFPTALTDAECIELTTL